MVWLTASLVLGIAAEGLLAHTEQQCPMKELQTDFNMTKVHR
jgi:hypothetical protein